MVKSIMHVLPCLNCCVNLSVDICVRVWQSMLFREISLFLLHMYKYYSRLISSVIFVLQKLESRNAILLKTNSLTDAQKDLWKKVVVKEFMSSEESGEEEIAGEKRQVINIKPLCWRAPKVNRFFKQLDRKAGRVRSRQSKQQTLPRVAGRRSTRPKPIGFSDDFFGFTAP